jgi:hypothetical protein
VSRSGLCTGRTERGTRCRRRVGPDAGQCHLNRSPQRRTTDTTATEVAKIAKAIRPSGFETLLAGQIRTAGFQDAIAKAIRSSGAVATFLSLLPETEDFEPEQRTESGLILPSRAQTLMFGGFEIDLDRAFIPFVLSGLLLGVIMSPVLAPIR